MSTPVLAGKRPPEDTRWRPSRASAPHRKSRPAAQRSGGHQGVATRKATGDPATHGGAGDPASVQEQCVGTCDRGLEKARRTGAVELLRYAAWFSGCGSLAASAPSFLLLVRSSSNHAQWWSRRGVLRDGFPSSRLVGTSQRTAWLHTLRRSRGNSQTRSPVL